VDGVGAADCGGTGLGQADVADLALSDEFGQSADGFFDWGFWVNPVLVVEVDAVGPEPLQPECETKPNFVANTIWSRRSLMARPTSSSFV
jgi:hypothetical protein